MAYGLSWRETSRSARPRPKLDLEAIPRDNRTGYPPPHNEAVSGRWYRRISTALGLQKLGAREVTLEPGAWSSQRHWHISEDELAVMLSGEAVLVEDDGETALLPGDVCVWPAGAENGHVIQNRSTAKCRFVVVSAGQDTGGHYSDIDMKWGPEGFTPQGWQPLLISGLSFLQPRTAKSSTLPPQPRRPILASSRVPIPPAYRPAQSRERRCRK